MDGIVAETCDGLSSEGRIANRRSFKFAPLGFAQKWR
jgi:hypothetical protein